MQNTSTECTKKTGELFCFIGRPGIFFFVFIWNWICSPFFHPLLSKFFNSSFCFGVCFVLDIHSFFRIVLHFFFSWNVFFSSLLLCAFVCLSMQQIRLSSDLFQFLLGVFFLVPLLIPLNKTQRWKRREKKKRRRERKISFSWML